MELKEILKEELKVSGENLKEKGIELGKEALEEVAKEMSNMLERVADKTPNKGDDFYKVIKPMIDEKLEGINPDD